MVSRPGILVAAGVALSLVAPARADPDERTDRARALHAIPVVVGAATYLLLELPLKDRITPKQCRWCEPNGFDTAMRSALRWDDVRLANTLSNLTGYLGNPLYASGMLVFAAGDERSGVRSYDDTVPVLQAAIFTGLVNQTLKVVFGRKRPFAAFHAQAVRPANDVNTSFFSGHTALAFALATSSGTVASLREYSSAPAIWIGGLTLATATGYLRIAGDAHYATDVLTGALIGSAIGIAVPMLLHREVLTDEALPVARPNALPDRRPIVVSFGGAF